ncbi:MAG: LysM peptidoglycan-binding domain-containing protein [Phycisphaerales bacterium]
MRKDVKTGIVIGTVLCLAAAVWFCVHQEIMQQPQTREILSEKKDLFVNEEPKVQIDLTEKGSQKIAESAPSVRMHIVSSGQTLSDISKIYYGSTTGWSKIYQANRDQLSKGPNAIKAGMKLVIPQ